MKCPTCPDSTLVMSDRAGIEIDYCPTCRGVWLDRGELDKIIERSAAAAPQPMAPQAAPQPASRIADADAPRPSPNSTYHSKYHSKYHAPQGQYPRKKKSSFLGELFDF